MSRKSAEAIILRTRPVGEADLIVTFLTTSEGKLAGSARSARRSRRRFGGALEPLTRGRATWTESEGRELVRLESFDVTASFASRQGSLPWFFLFAYLAEVADTFARDREPDPRFYRLLRAASEAADRGATPEAVRRWFETWTLRLQGLFPDLDACARCRTRPERAVGLVVGLEGGEPLCEACARIDPPSGEKVRLSAAEVRWVRLAMGTPISRMPQPGSVPGIDRLVRLLFLNFTGAPFRSARFLETV